VPVLLLLLGCTSRAPDAVLAYLRGADGYTIAPRPLPALVDPGTMSGTLGDVRHGGRLVGSDGEERYTGGRGLTVRYGLDEGVAVPADQDGLLLFSFYAHLSDARDALAAQGVDLSPMFPVAIAWNPAVSPLLEVSPADNAAYAIGANLFLLLADGDDRDVPLLANAGVVSHELGHALFHLRMAGDPLAQAIVTDPASRAGMWQASLHEGFADALAALLLDDPRFLDASVTMPARDLDGTAILTEALLPDPDTLADSLLPIYDPYALGTVFASLVWDLRVATDDPEGTLALLLAAVDAWAPAEDADFDGERFLDALHTAAIDVGQQEIVCDAIAVRMDGLLGVEGCR
jgi:hypothetical protein